MAGAYQDTVISMDQPLREPKKDAVESVTFVPDIFEGAFPGASKEQKKQQAQYLNYMVNVRNVPVNHAVGILANIYRESSFDPSSKSKGESSYGLLQWNDSEEFGPRGQRMKDFVGEDWETNWKKQLDYAIVEVQLLDEGVDKEGNKIYGEGERFHDMYLGSKKISGENAAYLASDWLVDKNIGPGKAGSDEREYERTMRRGYISRLMSNAKGWKMRESKNAIFKSFLN
jgi:hypothetical protein